MLGNELLYTHVIDVKKIEACNNANKHTHTPNCLFLMMCFFVPLSFHLKGLTWLVDFFKLVGLDRNESISHFVVKAC